MDVTDVQVEYSKEPDYSVYGEQNVGILVWDGAENETELETELIIRSVVEEITVEAGSTVPDCSAFLIPGMQGNTELVFFTDMQNINMNQVGDYDINIQADGIVYMVKMHIVDTMAPVITLKDLTIYSGDSLKIEDFVESVVDVADISYDYVTEPDVSTPGESEITIKAMDESGNATEGTAVLTVLRPEPEPIKVENDTENGFEESTLQVYEEAQESVPTEVSAFQGTKLNVECILQNPEGHVLHGAALLCKRIFKWKDIHMVCKRALSCADRV